MYIPHGATGNIYSAQGYVLQDDQWNTVVLAKLLVTGSSDQTRVAELGASEAFGGSGTTLISIHAF